MATTQYIGSRYVPVFADPIEWDSARAFEPLTIVTHKGNSYTSKQAVPAGIDIDNETYWANTGNYNAQVEQYRNETKEAVREVEQTGEEAKQSADAAADSAKAAYQYATDAEGSADTAKTYLDETKQAKADGVSAIETAQAAGVAAVKAQETESVAAVKTQETESVAAVKTQETESVVAVRQAERPTIFIGKFVSVTPTVGDRKLKLTSSEILGNDDVFILGSDEFYYVKDNVEGYLNVNIAFRSTNTASFIWWGFNNDFKHVVTSPEAHNGHSSIETMVPIDENIRDFYPFTIECESTSGNASITGQITVEYVPPYTTE